MSRLISDLENIVLRYLSVDDYYKLYRSKKKLYTWERYFKNNLPDIYQAIEYNNLNLIKYILSKNPVNAINYNLVKFKSRTVTRFIINKYSISPVEDDMEYDPLVFDAVATNNSDVLRYLLDLKIYTLEADAYIQLTHSCFDMLELKTIKILHHFAKHNLDDIDYRTVIDDFISISVYSESTEIKKHAKCLENRRTLGLR